MDLITLNSTLTGFVGLVRAARELTLDFKGKDEKQEKVEEQIRRIEEATFRIGELSWSLNDYLELQKASNTLKVQTEAFLAAYGLGAGISPERQQTLKAVLENAYRGIRSSYVQSLAPLLGVMSIKYFDEKDKGTIETTLQDLANRFGYADGQIEAKDFNFVDFRLTLNQISYAADKLLGLAQIKVRLILEGLMTMRR